MSLKHCNKHEPHGCRCSGTQKELAREVWDDFPEYMAPNRYLQLYVPPVLLVLGTVGNLLSFVIMSRNMFKASTYSYLAALAIMDILVLYIGLLRMWVGSFSVDIQLISNWMCKLVTFLGYVSSVTSVWLIIAVTIERFIAVKFPLRAPRMCNVHRARIVILTMFIATCFLNMHYMWTVELKADDANGTMSRQCEASSDHRVLVVEVWPWVDAAVYSLVPFTVITILNILIVRCVLAARRQRSSMQHGDIFNKYLSVNCQGSNVKRPVESSKKLTCMLLAVSFTFLLTTLPMNVLLLVRAFTEHYNKDRDSLELKRHYAQMTLARTVAELLMYVNHSVNFFLYCATGRKFRRQVKMLLCLCCQGKIKEFFVPAKRPSTSTIRTSTSTRTSTSNRTSTCYRLSQMTSLPSPSPSSSPSVVVECDRKYATCRTRAHSAGSRPRLSLI